jgi:pimeloyl-ACP methyl ester carboxylesterase
VARHRNFIPDKCSSPAPFGPPASICIKDMISRFVIETFRAFGPPLQWPLLSYEVVAEACRNFGDPIFRGHNVRYGDGKPVLLVPGHLAGDATLFPLAMWLRAIGYRPSQLALPINLDDRLLDNSLAAALREAARRVERKAVIIAFGTGARVALRVAALEHAHVSDVIALGLPDCLPLVPESVRLHGIGRLPLQRDVRGELHIVEGSDALLPVNPKAFHRLSEILREIPISLLKKNRHDGPSSPDASDRAFDKPPDPPDVQLG